MRCSFSYVAILIGLLTLTASAIQPRKCRFGQVQDLELTDTVELKWPAVYGERPELNEGEKFAILHVTLAPGKSIGKYDYTLSGGKCLAIALPGDTFTPENYEQVASTASLDVQLLYKVDEAGAPYTMSLEYNIPALPDKHITLLEEQAPPPAIEEEAPAEAETGEPVEEAAAAVEGEAPEDVTAAEPEPAPEPKPEPKKAEPKPEPKKAETKPAPKPEEPVNEVEDFVDDW